MQAFEQLEQEFGQFIGNPNTVAVASGTAALHIACEVARDHITDDTSGVIRPKIAIPEYTMIACARAATMADMHITFVDCNDNLQMNMDLVPCDVEVVMAVHIYGNLSDIHTLHRKVGSATRVIEDMAEVHGALPHPDSFAACWSFYKNKTIHGEEGGMIVFKDAEDVKLAKQLRTLGFDDNHDYFHVPRGINARMSNAHAELILPSLACYKRNRDHKRFLAGGYDDQLPQSWQTPMCIYPWVYPLRIVGLDRPGQHQLVKQLNEAGIAARHGFKSMLLQAEYSHLRERTYKCTNAMSIQSEIIYLPLSETMSQKDVDDITTRLLSIAEIVIPQLTPAE